MLNDARNILPAESVGTSCGCKERSLMNQIIYLVGLVVVVMAVLSFIGIR